MINRVINTVVQSELVSKVLQHEAVLEMILSAVTSSLEARDALSSRYDALLSQAGLVTLSQHEALKKRIEQLNESAEGLNEQIDLATQTARTQRRRAERAEADVAELSTLLENARAELSALQSERAAEAQVEVQPEALAKAQAETPKWRESMTKAELLKVASAVGLELSAKLKKRELIEQLRSLTS